METARGRAGHQGRSLVLDSAILTEGEEYLVRFEPKTGFIVASVMPAPCPVCKQRVAGGVREHAPGTPPMCDPCHIAAVGSYADDRDPVAFGQTPAGTNHREGGPRSWGRN